MKSLNKLLWDKEELDEIIDNEKSSEESVLMMIYCGGAPGALAASCSRGGGPIREIKTP